MTQAQDLLALAERVLVAGDRRQHRYSAVEFIGGLALSKALLGEFSKRDTTCRYREPAGPPAPVSRQVRRAMMRQSHKASARALAHASKGGGE